MIETQYCQPARQRRTSTPSHLQPQGRDVKAAAFEQHRRSGAVSRGQKTVMAVMWRRGVPLTRKMIVANCSLEMCSVTGRVKELLDKGFIECEQTIFDPDTRIHVRALTLTDAGIAALAAAQESETSVATAPAASKKPAKKSRPLIYAKRAAILCGDYDFCCYLYEHDQKKRERLRHGNEVAVFPCRPVPDKHIRGRSIVCERYADKAAVWLRTELHKISSRTEIDNNKVLQEMFHEIIWDFAKWVAKRGRPAPVLQLMGAQ